MAGIVAPVGTRPIAGRLHRDTNALAPGSTRSGQASGRFECQQPGSPGLVEVQGSYSSQRYEMTMVGTDLADRNGSGLVVPKIYMKHEGRHTGACAG
jgi:hypothetical protein